MVETVKPVALITGASSGLGEAFSRQLASQGYHLILVARRKEKLQSLAAELIKLNGVEIEALPANLVNESDIKRVEKRILALGQLDVLINCAGFGLADAFDRQLLEKQLAMLQLHCAAPVRLVHAALPGMIAHQHGAIINVASLSAFTPLVGNVMYSGTKAFLVNFSRSLALENRRHGIRTQALCPGFFHSEFHATMRVNKSVIPHVLFLTADETARRSLSALRRKNVVYIPGFFYQLAVFVVRLPCLGDWLVTTFSKLAGRWRSKFIKVQGS